MQAQTRILERSRIGFNVQFVSRAANVPPIHTVPGAVVEP
jgi:hypothetical protein